MKNFRTGRMQIGGLGYPDNLSQMDYFSPSYIEHPDQIERFGCLKLLKLSNIAVKICIIGNYCCGGC